MNISYQSALVLVKDLKVSRAFYEEALSQKVKYDFGQDVVFHGGFTIHDADHFSNLLFNRSNPHINNILGQENFELYFECDDMEAVFSQLMDHVVVLIHPIHEQPWGQRVFRFYDPDKHIVEIGEPMPAVIKRYLKAGASEEEIAQRTAMPLDEIKRIKAETSG